MRKLLLLFIFILTGCHSLNDGAVDFKNFIQSFNKLDSLKVESVVNVGSNCQIVFSSFESINKKETESLRVKYNDINFNRRMVPFTTQHPLYPNMSSIDLVSDKDFDELHPAQTSLSDISSFRGVTAFPYLEKGFNGAIETVIDKKLNELTANELRLTAYQFNIEILKEPTIKGLHKFKLIINTEDNRVIEVPFEQMYK